MIEVQFFIPTFANDGTAFTETHFTAWETTLAVAFGGFSLFPGTVAGAWRSPKGETFTDRLRVYGVFLPSIVEGAKVGDCATFARAHFGQEAIAIRYLGLSEVL